MQYKNVWQFSNELLNYNSINMNYWRMGLIYLTLIPYVHTSQFWCWVVVVQFHLAYNIRFISTSVQCSIFQKQKTLIRPIEETWSGKNWLPSNTGNTNLSTNQSWTCGCFRVSQGTGGQTYELVGQEGGDTNKGNIWEQNPSNHPCIRCPVK